MELSFTEEQFVQWLARIMRTTFEESAVSYLFDFSQYRPGAVYSLSKDELSKSFEYLTKEARAEQTTVHDARTYENMIAVEGQFGDPFFRLRMPIVKEDSTNCLTYTLGTPSTDYLLFLLSKFNEIGIPRTFRPRDYFRYRRPSEDDELPRDMFALIKGSLPRVYTVRIDATENKRQEDLRSYASAFLFQLAYNLDVSFVETRLLDEFFRSERIIRARRPQIDEMEAPKRVYIADLIYHYQMAVATDSPLLQYLSYYHIAEHFFDQIYSDDLVDGVIAQITKPDFSYRRKKDVRKLVKYISDRQSVRGDSVIFNEQESLKLTIQKHINCADLREELDNYDPELVNYYQTTQVAFSDGGLVPFDTDDTRKLAEKLAARIYKTRNAIVHSKENEKRRYIPFQHDKLLVKEIPLLRFIAEQIILQTSTVIGT